MVVEIFAEVRTVRRRPVDAANVISVALRGFRFALEKNRRIVTANGPDGENDERANVTVCKPPTGMITDGRGRGRISKQVTLCNLLTGQLWLVPTDGVFINRNTGQTTCYLLFFF